MNQSYLLVPILIGGWEVDDKGLRLISPDPLHLVEH